MKIKGFKVNADFIPRFLPCGREVNKTWEPGDIVECCITVCPGLDIETRMVDHCYNAHKNELMPMLDPKLKLDFISAKDQYFMTLQAEANKAREEVK